MTLASSKPLFTRMLLGQATARWDKPEEANGNNWSSCLLSHEATAFARYPTHLVLNQPMMEAYQACYRAACYGQHDLLAMLHDDLSIYETGWDQRVLAEFADPTVGAVGFFGALAACNPRLYQDPEFNPAHFARGWVVSNCRREAHLIGERYTGSLDVAQFDGMALVVRRTVLDQLGGWPVSTPIRYYNYDLWLSYEVRRLGYRLRVVGIDCDHWSGKSMPFAKARAASRGETDPCGDEAWLAAHRYLYDRYRGDGTGTGVIPWRVTDERRVPRCP